MHLLDDVRLIESEFWPRPLPLHSSTRILSQQVMNSAILENSSVIVHGNMIGSHRWQKTGKITVFLLQSRGQ